MLKSKHSTLTPSSLLVAVVDRVDIKLGDELVTEAVNTATSSTSSCLEDKSCGALIVVVYGLDEEVPITVHTSTSPVIEHVKVISTSGQITPIKFDISVGLPVKYKDTLP